MPPKHPTTKKELALAYFPDSPTAQAAVRRLMAWADRCPELRRALAKAHYRRSEKTLTPRQVELFTRYLGEP